jgi:hypothetical protein
MVALAATPAAAATIKLYDSGLNTFPVSQGWFAFTPGATQTSGPGGTILDTTAANSLQAGYARIDQNLDATAGYTIRLDLQVLSEAHGSSDRAGVSLLVLSSNQRGIELGFWQDSIWAQNTGFTQGESTPFNTTSGIQRYDLSISGSTYSLYANGNTILSGPLRDYTSSNASFLGIPVYQTPNLLFLGDNTTSARGRFQVSQMELTDQAIATVPAPSLLLGLIGLGWRVLKKVKADS